MKTFEMNPFEMVELWHAQALILQEGMERIKVFALETENTKIKAIITETYKKGIKKYLESIKNGEK